MVESADLGNIRERIPVADSVEVARERERLAIDRDLVEWINEHSSAGGWFRSHGDAAEKALGRLRTEHDFIRKRCRETGTRFNAKAFFTLYQADLDAVATKPGRPRKTEVRVAASHVLVRATMAVELMAWVHKVWLRPDGPLERLAQVVQVGIRRLRAGGHRLEPDDEEPKLTLKPDEFWQLYQKIAAQSP